MKYQQKLHANTASMAGRRKGDNGGERGGYGHSEAGVIMATLWTRPATKDRCFSSCRSSVSIIIILRLLVMKRFSSETSHPGRTDKSRGKDGL